MDTSAFWKLVDKARRMAEEDAEQQLKELAILLEALPTEEIVQFHYLFCSFFHASYTWPLWGAAYIIGGGCSDDSFDYFRGWLISRGEKVFAAAVADPDKLASMIKEEDQDIDCQVEGWQSVAIDAWCKKTGQNDSAFPARPTEGQPADPSGDRWAEEDLDRLFPKLAKRFN